MKHLFTSVIIAMLLNNATLLTAQNVGVGTTTPHASAMLDVSSNNKGVLVPRMTTVQRNAISTPAKGLLVYDTDANGLFHFNGSAWVNLAGGGDATSIFAKTGYTIHNAGNHHLDNFIFGAAALPLPGVSTTGSMFFLDRSTSAIRGGSLYQSNNWAPENLGLFSIAFGRNVRASGNSSYVLGQSAAATGSDALSIGWGTIARNNKEMAVGFFNDTTNNNQIFSIGNGNSNADRSNVLTVLSNGNVGIGPKGYVFPTAQLDLTGTLRYRGSGLQNLPSTGAVLTSVDQNGNAEWQRTVGFSAIGLNSANVGAGWTKLLFSTTSYNAGFPYYNNEFAAPVKGIYHFDFHAGWRANGGSGIRVVVVRNGSIVKSFEEVWATCAICGQFNESDVIGKIGVRDMSVSFDFALEKNDKVWAEAYQNPSVSEWNPGPSYLATESNKTWFNGHLVGRL